MRKEPFKQARCSDGLEERIKVGLKTMLKRTKSDKKMGNPRTHKREKSNKDNILNKK